MGCPRNLVLIGYLFRSVAAFEVWYHYPPCPLSTISPYHGCNWIVLVPLNRWSCQGNGLHRSPQTPTRKAPKGFRSFGPDDATSWKLRPGTWVYIYTQRHYALTASHSGHLLPPHGWAHWR